MEKDQGIDILPTRENMLLELESTLGLTRKEKQRLLITEKPNPENPQELDYITVSWLATKQLEEIFVSDNIPSIMRRRVPAFDSQTPLEMMFQGKIEGVVAFYDDITNYSKGAVWKILLNHRLNRT